MACAQWRDNVVIGANRSTIRQNYADWIHVPAGAPQMEMAEYLDSAEAEDEGATLMFAVRSGTSDLRVDRDRRFVPNREDRCCGLCEGRHVEDAHHVFNVCPAHSAARRTLLSKLPPALRDLQDDQVFNAVLGSAAMRDLCPDDVTRRAAIHATKTFLVQVFRLRRRRGA